MLRTRLPRTPTQEPTGSTRGSVAHDGDLGPVARLARDSLDDHDAVMDFADFALEEFEDEFGAGARNDQARPRRVDVDLLQVGVDPLAGLVLFAVDLLLGGHDPLGALEVDDDAARVETADDAVQNRADPVGELVLDVLLLRLAQLLDHRLPRGLRRDAAEVVRRDLPLDDVAELHVRETLPGAGDDELVAGRIFLHDLEHGPGADRPGRRVDLDLQLVGRVDAFARPDQNGIFQSANQAVAADSALLLDVVENLKQLVSHINPPIAFSPHPGEFSHIIRPRALFRKIKKRAELHPLHTYRYQTIKLLG